MRGMMASRRSARAVAGFADDVFEAVGAAGDHEVGGAEQRQEAHLASGREAAAEGPRGGRVSSRGRWRRFSESGSEAMLLAMYR